MLHQVRPHLLPHPGQEVDHPGGKPASWKISKTLAPTTTASSAGLAITVFPTATGPTIIPVKMATGKFQGAMTTPAPRGT